MAGTRFAELSIFVHRTERLYQLLRVYQKLDRKREAEHALDQLKQLKAKAAENMTGVPETVGEETPPR